MLGKIKKLTSTEKGLIVIIIILLFGIVLRWGYIGPSAQKGFDKYIKTDTITAR